MSDVIFTAATVHTLNGYRPQVEAVLVRDGWIVCAGSLEECRSWSDSAAVDDRFSDKVLMPGMIEAHGHTAEGAMLAFPYVGYYDVPRPDGSTSKGVRSYEDLLEVLREADAALDPGAPLIAVGFDPIYFTGQERLSRTHLDHVSVDRPIFVRHASGHLGTVNSAMLQAEGITADSAPGVDVDDDGELTGELQESSAMMLARCAMQPLLAANGDPQGIVDYGRLCRNAGVTTTTELVGAAILAPQAADLYAMVVNDPAFPARMAIYNLPGLPGEPADYAAAAQAALGLRERNSEKLRFNGIKLVGDGSLQGWTACCSHPGYYTGEDQGLAQFSDEDITLAVSAFHKAGLQIYCHANGDAAADQFINAVDLALRDYAWLDHRHTVQHSQVTRAAQYRRMARLGIAANIFTNHIWYWGDQHRDAVMGPERVERMWACKSAMEAGVSVTYHSDSGVTPTSQLHTAWCAVNRLTPSGRILGEAERVSVDVALRAVTIEAAYQLHMDDEVGSIEAGKRADFAVLEADPYEAELREIPVWGTVVGGVVFEAEKP